jgi:hypothetical protein
MKGYQGQLMADEAKNVIVLKRNPGGRSRIAVEVCGKPRARFATARVWILLAVWLVIEALPPWRPR